MWDTCVGSRYHILQARENSLGHTERARKLIHTHPRLPFVFPGEYGQAFTWTTYPTSLSVNAAIGSLWRSWPAYLPEQGDHNAVPPASLAILFSRSFYQGSFPHSWNEIKPWFLFLRDKGMMVRESCGLLVYQSSLTWESLKKWLHLSISSSCLFQNPAIWQSSLKGNMIRSDGFSIVGGGGWEKFLSSLTV